MLNKLAYRNAKRSMKDYLIYLITMTAVSAMMFAFNSLIFSPDIQKMCSEAAVLAAMLGVVTFFVVLIVAWLINYMARFMLEKRSREFATYLLIGLKKKELSRLYMRENLLIGVAAFFLGMAAGTFLQQVLMTIFYSVFNQDYSLHIQINRWCLLMTACCYFGCYLIALFRNKRVFKKMTIAQLLRMERENHQIKEGRERLRQLWFFVAVFYILFVYVMMVVGTDINTALLLMIGFIVAVYLLFSGLSAFLVCRVQKKRAWTYRNNRIFLYRQMSSKVRTMRFTMGTLTILFIFALLGGSFSLMFARYQSQAVDYSMPFEVLIHSPQPEDDFAEELAVIEKCNPVERAHIYQIYQNGTGEMNQYYSDHVVTALGTYYDETGNYVGDEDGFHEYYEYDTCMKLSDYNALREMLGEETIELKDTEYALQTKPRIVSDLGEDIYDQTLQAGGKALTLSGICTEAFCQNGINGADYLLIIPDVYAEQMTPFYSVMAADIQGSGSQSLLDELDKVHRHKHGILTYDEYEAMLDEDANTPELPWTEDLLGATGTDEIIVFIADLIVRDVNAADMKFVITAITFPLAYIALIFVCVALTILAVQQLSDSGKYKFRYDILRKLGMRKRERDRLIFRQLAMFYLIPAICAAAISSVIVIYAGNQFVKYTGASGNGVFYFAISLVLFTGVYVLYFAATYIGFKRNVK